MATSLNPETVCGNTEHESHLMTCKTQMVCMATWNLAEGDRVRFLILADEQVSDRTVNWRLKIDLEHHDEWAFHLERRTRYAEIMATKEAFEQATMSGELDCWLGAFYDSPAELLKGIQSLRSLSNKDFMRGKIALYSLNFPDIELKFALNVRATTSDETPEWFSEWAGGVERIITGAMNGNWAGEVLEDDDDDDLDDEDSELDDDQADEPAGDDSRDFEDDEVIGIDPPLVDQPAASIPLVGDEITLEYPSPVYGVSDINVPVLSKTIVVTRIQDTTKEPIDAAEIVANPLGFYGRWRIFGMNIESNQFESVYLDWRDRPALALALLGSDGELKSVGEPSNPTVASRRILGESCRKYFSGLKEKLEREPEPDPAMRFRLGVVCVADETTATEATPAAEFRAEEVNVEPRSLHQAARVRAAAILPINGHVIAGQGVGA